MSPTGSSRASLLGSQREHKPFDKTEDTDDDKHSTISHDSGVPRAEHALDALRLVAGDRVRHARCAPEFLEEIATKGAHDELRKASGNNVKVIGGAEARSFFRNYLSDHNKSSARHPNDKITNEIMPSPIVFAVTVFDATIKCVDYYMTWRGTKKSRRGKGTARLRSTGHDLIPRFLDVERRIEFLDAEFRVLAKKMDEDYKRISSLRKHGNLSPLKSTFDTKPPSASRKHRTPPGIAVSNPEDPDSSKVQLINPALPDPPASAADSVMSLPLLNMVRGVPFSHRVPLRLANPDRMSLISEIDVLPVFELAEKPTTSKLATVDEHIPLNENHAPTNTPSHRLSKHGHEVLKKSSESILSSDTKSSKSSRSSRSSSNSENKRSSSPNRENHSFKDEEPPQFMIYFLGDSDKLDMYRDTKSWHGLERSTSIRSLPPDRHSPWVGPLASNDTPGFRHSPIRPPSDSDSEESGGESNWKNSPVVPLKSHMEAMGFIPQFYRSPPVIPGGKYISVGTMGSPAPNHSPYLYSSPYLESSPYGTWLPPIQALSNAPSSRPVSQAYSPASYASPYMQSHTGPF